MMRRCLWRGASCAIALSVSGCAHTLPSRPVLQTSVLESQRGEPLIIGICGFHDVCGFDYGAELKSILQRKQAFAEVLETADVSDPRCDLVVVGNFCYSSVATRTPFYFASIYFFLLPTLSGIPTTNVDGEFAAAFEVYRTGTLLRSFQYENIFREARSYATLYPPSTSLDSQMRRIANHLASDLRSLGK